MESYAVVYKFHSDDLKETLQIICYGRGMWVAQSIERPALGFSSGHDLTVHEFKPRVGPHTDSAEPAWNSVSPSLSLPLSLPFLFSLSLAK